ncbi:MAG: T9SS type A sorting domain-containing protein [Ignavibacteria bacterium]|nr:T9SS type A sorting domain-containing protein [Ignavibacteria bacterium]
MIFQFCFRSASFSGLFTAFMCALCFLPSLIHAQWSFSGNLQNSSINSLLCRGDTVYSATGGAGFFYSSDNGADWLQENSGLGQNLNANAITLSNGKLFLSTVSQAVFMSDPPGGNWLSTGPGITQNNVPALISDSSAVYAGCILAGVFRTTNLGQTWTRFALGEGDLLYSLHKNEQGFFIGLAGGGYRSTNNGVNWSSISSGLLNANVHSLDSKTGLLFAGTNIGFFRSSDVGSSWIESSQGLPSLWINEIEVINGAVLAATRNNGVYISLNNGNNWTAINSGMADTNILSISHNATYVFAGSAQGNVWKIPVQTIPVSVNSGSELMHPKNPELTVYPNPFNPSANIRFNLPEGGSVLLTLYDIQGKEIETLLNEYRREGIHEVKLGSGELAAGVYFCKLKYNSTIITQRIVLTK